MPTEPPAVRAARGEKAPRRGRLQAVTHSQAVIQHAKGSLIRTRGCTAQEAFDILVRLSQDTNRKLRDVAEVLVREATGGAGTGGAAGGPAVAAG